MSNVILPGDTKSPVYVYEWKAWSRYLFPSLCKEAIRIEAKIRHSNSGILKKLAANKGYFLFHINLTRTASFFKNKEELVTQLKNKGITPLNAAVNDTSKRYLQTVCEQQNLHTTKATIEGDENELLIIKTNLNYGGRPEKRLMRSELRRLNPGSLDYDIDVVYPVTERKKIKDETWQDKNLVIEKYIANQGNFIYRVYKLLNKIVVAEVMEDGLIKKLRSVIKRTNYHYHLDGNGVLPGGDVKFHHLLADVIKLCKALYLDFAAIDIVKSDEDKYYIIDVNLTPNWNMDKYPEMLSFLSDGLYQ